MPKRLLLLSNSTNIGEPFLEYPMPRIKHFLGGEIKSVLFVPFAAVRISFDEYVGRVRERLSTIGLSVEGIHETSDPIAAVRNAEAIMIGGGNTFHLLTHLYRSGVVEEIRKKVLSGTPYIGWSAGSNVACPTIKTTNDMPVIEPDSLTALGLTHFQLNPHYTDGRSPNLNGETRDDRLLEFLEINREMKVVGLREGTMLHVEDEKIKLIGPHAAKIFRYGQEPMEVAEDDFDESLLL